MAANFNAEFEPFFKDVSVNPNIIPMNSEKMEEKVRSRMVFIDSRHRDITKFPNPSKYEIIFSEPFENVSAIELISTQIPFSDPNEPYIVVKIGGMDLYQSNNGTINKATTVIYEVPDSTNVNNEDSIVKKCNPPRPIFNFKVSFYKHDGTLYDFQGAEHSLKLKITTLKQVRRF